MTGFVLKIKLDFYTVLYIHMIYIFPNATCKLYNIIVIPSSALPCGYEATGANTYGKLIVFNLALCNLSSHTCM